MNSYQVTLSNKLPVLLIPGYAEPSWYFMYGIYKMLRRHNYPVFKISLFPNIGNIRKSAKQVRDLVEATLAETGAPKINLVAHSMGGLISRYYIQSLAGVEKVKNLITITTPHYGTNMAVFAIGKCARQMVPGSKFLRELNKKGEIYGDVRYTCIWTDTDEIVIPPHNSVLTGAHQVNLVRFTEHISILFSRRTYEHILTALGSS